eukprot:Amastigsp_a676730_815.p2 type:complete len:328 gc:universal Amastigsp_a676730_815:57-1040(+)
MQALCAFLLLGLALCVASAQFDPTYGAMNPGATRSVSPKPGSDKTNVVFTSWRISEDRRAGDFIVMGLYAGNDVLVLDSFSHNRVGRTVSNQNIRFRVVALVEFVDANGNSLYDAGEEVTNGVTLLRRAGWLPFDCTDATEPITQPGTNALLFGCSVTHAALDLTFSFTLADRDVQVGNMSLPANAIKFDMVLRNYPYQASGSMLALVTNIFSNERLIEGARTAGRVATINIGNVGNFAYEPTVLVNGNLTVSVGQSPFERPPAADMNQDKSSFANANLVSYTFQTTERVSTLVWDPTLTNNVDTSSAAALVPSLALLALALFVLVL